MAKKRKDADDELLLAISEGLVLLTLDKRFDLAEADNFQRAFAEIVHMVGAVSKLEKEVAELRAEIARTSRPRAVA